MRFFCETVFSIRLTANTKLPSHNKNFSSHYKTLLSLYEIILCKGVLLSLEGKACFSDEKRIQKHVISCQH